ncbi:hypothetical protein BSLA_02f4902 [Burkholderia stabilis]|nr:hypothetical protein BSLA_02f4902 [Burkholderia stabilis]
MTALWIMWVCHDDSLVCRSVCRTRDRARLPKCRIMRGR